MDKELIPSIIIISQQPETSSSDIPVFIQMHCQLMHVHTFLSFLSDLFSMQIVNRQKSCQYVPVYLSSLLRVVFGWIKHHRS